jgi:hypothetical protein
VIPTVIAVTDQWLKALANTAFQLLKNDWNASSEQTQPEEIRLSK